MKEYKTKYKETFPTLPIFLLYFLNMKRGGRRGSQEKVSSKHRFLLLLNIQFITSKATRQFSKVILSNVLIVFFDQVSSFVNSYLDFSTCKSLLTNSNKKCQQELVNNRVFQINAYKGCNIILKENATIRLIPTNFFNSFRVDEIN